jgi:hypothetical protein
MKEELDENSPGREGQKGLNLEVNSKEASIARMCTKRSLIRDPTRNAQTN